MDLMDPEVKRLAHEAWRGYAEKYAELEQRQLEQMNESLRDFLEDLLNYPLVRPWRESLDLFQEHYWQQAGMRLTPDSYQKVAVLIEELVNDPRCYAHGPIQPDAQRAKTDSSASRRRFSEIIAEDAGATARLAEAAAMRAKERGQLQRFARRCAYLEQQRIDFSDEEWSQYEYYLYQNILRARRGEPPLPQLQCWIDRNDAFNEKHGSPRRWASTAAVPDNSTPGKERAVKLDDRPGVNNFGLGAVANKPIIAQAAVMESNQDSTGPVRVIQAAVFREEKWLEVRVNVVLFPFGSYKTDNFAADIAEANKIFEPAHIKLKLGSTRQLSEDDTMKAARTFDGRVILGPDGRLILDPDKLTAVAGPKEAGTVTVYYVPAITGGAGLRISDDSAVVTAAGSSGTPRQRRVLAHELAHVLGRLPHDETDVRNLMIVINTSNYKALGLADAWEAFKAKYSGPADQKRFDSFVYSITAQSTVLSRDQIRRMRLSRLLRESR